jgi:hypothetical protein
MVSLTALWLPILLSAVMVFVASSIIHMVLGYHSGDWKSFEREDAILDALRPFGLKSGDYVAPRPKSMADMNSPEFKAKAEKGPRIMMTVMGPSSSSMLKSLVLWFVYSVVVAIFAAYVAGITLGAGSPYMEVFRVTSTVAFAGYALALWQGWIWYSRGLRVTLLSTIDGLVYALLTGGAFAWLWP